MVSSQLWLCCIFARVSCSRVCQEDNLGAAEAPLSDAKHSPTGAAKLQPDQTRGEERKGETWGNITTLVTRNVQTCRSPETFSRWLLKYSGWVQSAHSAADHRLLAPGTALLLCVPPGEGGRVPAAQRTAEYEHWPYHVLHATALNILLSELTLI